MSFGFKSTLFAGVITLSAFAPAFAAAPLISNLPDITVGDLEDSTEATDNNLFVFSDAFAFSNFVVDADTTVTDLMWSFGEFSADANGGLADSQYTINGDTAINVGDQAIADDEANNHENAVAPGDKQINELSDLADFRDIVLSPAAGSTPFPEPTGEQITSATAGKVIRYYVSDGTNVDHVDALINTVDDAFDTSSPVFNSQYQEEERDSDLQGDGWVPSGLAWAAVTASKGDGRLSITVTPTQGKSRIFGWQNPGLVPYESVGADKFVRGKFFIYTNVSLFDPINKVPNFRLRVTHENAVNAAVHYELAQTGYSDPGNEPFYGNLNDPVRETKAGYWLRPADNALSPTPSLYRVDFDPVDVPAAAGSNIGALMESYSVSDTANGTLYLTEVVMGTYNALDNSGELVWEYNRTDADPLADGIGGAKAVTGGGFNHEPNVTPGYLQNLYFANTDPDKGGYYAFTDEGAAGVVGDTNAVPTDVFGIGLLSFTSVNNIDKLRIEENMLYHTRFYATAPVPTNDNSVESQGAIRFRFQTAANNVSYLLDMTPPIVATLNSDATPNAEAIATEALPGIGSENPDTDASLDTAGEDGGWYSVVASSPIDNDGIRNDVETVFDTENDVFYALNGEPGPTEAGDSARDVTVGVDFIQGPAEIQVNGVTLPFASPNRAVVRISAIEVYAYPSIDDGGFGFSGTHPQP